MTRKELDHIGNRLSKIYNEVSMSGRNEVIIHIHENEILQDGDYRYTYFYNYNGREIYNDSYHDNDVEKNIKNSIKNMYYNIKEDKELNEVVKLLKDNKYTFN